MCTRQHHFLVALTRVISCVVLNHCKLLFASECFILLPTQSAMTVALSLTTIRLHCRSARQALTPAPRLARRAGPRASALRTSGLPSNGLPKSSFHPHRCRLRSSPQLCRAEYGQDGLRQPVAASGGGVPSQPMRQKRAASRQSGNALFGLIVINLAIFFLDHVMHRVLRPSSTDDSELPLPLPLA